MSEVQLPQFFVDTSSASEIDALIGLRIFSGITTNPVIVAKEAGNTEPINYYRNLAERYPDLPISIQLLDEPLSELVDHAIEFSGIGPNVVVKIPMFTDGRGLKLLPRLIDLGIKTNITAIMSAEQALMVLKAGDGKGPEYISLFFNRIKDGGGDPVQEISNTRALIDHLGLKTKIITGSIRKPEGAQATMDVRQAVMAGTHIITIPPTRIWEMVSHPQSELFINQSQSNWEKYLMSQSES